MLSRSREGHRPGGEEKREAERGREREKERETERQRERRKEGERGKCYRFTGRISASDSVTQWQQSCANVNGVVPQRHEHKPREASKYVNAK